VERRAMAFEQDPQAGGVASLGRPDKLRVVQHHRVVFSWVASF
jgi:hypothetical protein